MNTPTPTATPASETPRTDAYKFTARHQPSAAWVYADDCATLEHELAAAVAERDEALFQWKRNIDEHDAIHRALAADLAAARSRIAELEGALRYAVENPDVNSTTSDRLGRKALTPSTGGPR